MEVQLTIAADSPLASLGALQAALADTRDALEAVGAAMRDRQSRVFQTADAGAWEALDPYTVDEKGSSRVLVDTGGLLKDLTGGSSGAQVTSDSVTISSTRVSAIMNRRGARGTPKRDPVPPTTPGERSAWAGIFLDVLTRSV